MDKKTLIDQACKAAEEFTKLYYECWDKRRHMMGKLYLENATMVWNGNALQGKNDVQKFVETLPSSEYTITCTDCQPILGFVKLQGHSSHSFQQSFIVTSLNNKWKIVTDCFRFQEVGPLSLQK